jgi:hypothetical protein
MNSPTYDKAQQLNARAIELADSWVNGNRSWVRQQIAQTGSCIESAALAVLLSNLLTDDNDREAFLAGLIRAVEVPR